MEIPEGPADEVSRRGGESAEARRGSTFIVARPGRDAVADLMMANRLRHVDDENEASPFWSPELSSGVDHDWGGREHGSADAVGEYIEQSSRFHHLMRFQEAVLALTDATLLAGLCMYLDGLSQSTPTDCPEEYQSVFEGHLHDSRTMSRRQLLAHPLPLRLPGLPRTSREGEEFALAVRRGKGPRQHRANSPAHRT
jgi:hypothetical protein